MYLSNVDWLLNIMDRLKLVLLLGCAFFSTTHARFISLKSSDVNVRVGPGREYPISWMLLRAGLPVMLLSEFLQWRKIQLPDGTQGWIHQSTTSYKNTAIVVEDTLLYKTSSGTTPIARICKNVIVQCIKTEDGFVKVKVNGFKGWIDISKLWGVNPSE